MPTQPRTKAAIVGCGAISVEHLKYLSASPLVDVVAVCDVSKAATEFARDRFGAAGAFTDCQIMLDQARPEIVHVLTPPHHHAPLVLACLDAGAHVICEKPMAGTAEETEMLLQHARKRGRRLIESRNYLYNDIVIKLSAMIADGRLGEVVEVDLLLSLDFLSGPLGDTNLEGASVRMPGGAVHDFLPHLAYLFLHFTGHHGELDDARGFFGNRSGNARAVFDHLDALVRAAGKRGRLRVVSDVAPDMFRVAIRGTLATVEADLFSPYLRLEGDPDIGKRAPLGQIRNGLTLIRAGVRNFREKVLQHGTYHGMPRMLDAIYRSIRDDTPPPVSERDMVASARLIDRLIQLGPPR